MATRKHTTPLSQLELSFTEPEHWRAIPGWDGYEVSNCGQVRSLDRTVPYHGGKSVKVIAGCMRTPQATRSGHQYVLLYKDGKPKNIHVHTLVLMAFVGPRPEGYVCNHLDANPSNNHVSNLEWCTQRENIHHAMRLGRMWFPYGERQNKAKLTDEKVKSIRRLDKEGMTRSELAARFGVSLEIIDGVRKRRYWKHVPED